MQTLRQILQRLWPVATGFAKRRLRVALALVESRAVLAPASPRRRGELALEGVTFSYREAREDLQGVSITVPAGRTVALVGLSGSGKSSLIRLLFRLYEPDAGRILLDGTPLRDLSQSALRRAIAVVPQDTVLFNDTIAANIGFGRGGASLLEIQEAARIAELHEFIAKLPYGYDTVVGAHGPKLSSGERQQVAIARAALKKPRIFIFDAAISALDARAEREIQRNLLSVSAHSTTLVIAHRLPMITHADQIIVLDRGEVRERGTHEQLCALNGAYAALWRTQQGAVSQREELPTSAAQG
jgi:ATP-binding cassette subfamily B protein